jgi:penicillin amidase
LKENVSEDDNFETVVSYLRNWDYSYDPSETAASIMDVFILNMSRNVLQDEMGPDTYRAFIEFSGQPVRILVRFMRDGSTFFDNVDTEERETMEEQVITSMKEALSWLIENQGAEPIEWRWELLHTLILESPLFSEAAKSDNAPKALQLVTNNILEKGPFPIGGHAQSLNNGEYLWNEPYAMVLGPSIRRIIDLSDTGTTLSILPTGQSGNPISEYYGDQTESWLNGEYKFFYQDSTLFDEAQLQTMKLLPPNQ